MLSYPIATAALLLLSQDADAASTPKQKVDFMRAMNSKNNKPSCQKLNRKDHEDFRATLHGNSKDSQALRSKLIQKSTVKKSPGEHKIEDTNDDANKDDNATANSNAYSNNANGNSNAERKLNGYTKSTDDYFMKSGEWNNGFGFDPTQFSLSYHRCAAVRQFDDDLAAADDSDSVFTTKHFAVFRFCPEVSCMGYPDEDFECNEEMYGQRYCEMMRQCEESYGQEYCQSLLQQEAGGEEGEDGGYNNAYGNGGGNAYSNAAAAMEKRRKHCMELVVRAINLTTVNT